MEPPIETQKRRQKIQKYHSYDCNKKGNRVIQIKGEDQTVICQFCGSEFIQEIEGDEDSLILKVIPEFELPGVPGS